MNIKVVIELDGTSSEIEEWLSRFGVARETTELRHHAVGMPALERGGDGWSEDRAERLVRRITPMAREALYVMANESPSVSFGELQTQLGITGVQLGGVLASFGFAENAGFPRPYHVDKRNRRYLIEPEVAQLFINAINEFEDR
jgi:hypothetical protein